ncbi:MAG: class I SAM-dependent methyltransferase [Deltaproteobacteria bacterium]|nr:class I SAM-dependent methyltransferase [Deltaproteobacteria bacterium]
MREYSKLAHNWLVLKVNNEQIERRLSLLKGVVYDLGCGTRPYEHDILLHAERYIGVDWDKSRRQPTPDLIADLNRPLNIVSESADCVVAFQVLEHVHEPALLISEAHRILRPGGLLMLSTPFQWRIHEAPWDYTRFTRFGLLHLLSSAGFSEISVEAVTGFWATWFLKLNYESKRLIRGPTFVRHLMRACLTPMWLVDQTIAPPLDRLWPSEDETAGYFTTARRVS